MQERLLTRAGPSGKITGPAKDNRGVALKAGKDKRSESISVIDFHRSLLILASRPRWGSILGIGTLRIRSSPRKGQPLRSEGIPPRVPRTEETEGNQIWTGKHDERARTDANPTRSGLAFSLRPVEVQEYSACIL